MNKISVVLLCCTVSLSAGSFAQEKKKNTAKVEKAVSPAAIEIDAPAPYQAQDSPAKGEVFIHVQQMPSFPGGSDKIVRLPPKA